MREMRTVVFWFMLFLSITMQSSFGKTRHLKWEVEYLHWSPDGVEGTVMAINGRFPGPAIRARAGDTIHLELMNKLHTEGLVIHWHGIRQLGTPWADGTASISQCAIQPGETFLYMFKLEKAGTYFYHGHYGMQRSAGLYGSLIVEVAEGEHEPFKYDGELNLLLSDWWHKGFHEQQVDLFSKPMRWVGEPQSLLINGRGQYNCSLAAHFSNTSTRACNLRGDEQYAPQVLRVHPNKTYRMRIASTTSLSLLNLAIEKHEMLLVEADGNYIEPFSVQNMDISSGESYSLLFTTDQNPETNYWISVSVRGRKPNTPQALTLLNYHPNSASRIPESPPPFAPPWDDVSYSKAFYNKILAPKGNPKPPARHDRRLVLLNTQNFIQGFTKWAINNASLALPSTPFLGSIRYGLSNGFDQEPPPDSYQRGYDVMKPAANKNSTCGSRVYVLRFNATVDVILQNANMIKDNVSETHPWHLHGHDFWVLGYGEGEFTDKDEGRFNLKNPPLRNTGVVFPFGWTALRFVANNPGVWAFHCHIEPNCIWEWGLFLRKGFN